MGDPVFVRTRHVYESYADLWRLIELAGFPTCYTDEVQPDSDNTYILAVRNGELPTGGYPGARARIIHWHAEFHVEYDPLPGLEVWSPDQFHADKIGAKYVPMGSDVRLMDGPDTPHQDEYDVAYLGYIVNRRNDILTDLKARGMRVSPTSAWGAERHRILTSSTTYLHVHQTDHAPAIPALRMVVAAAYSLPVICELPARIGIFGYGHMLTSDHAHIGQFAYMWAVKERGAFLQGFGDGLHRLLCHELPFRKSVECAL